MEYKAPVETYTGKVKEVVIGTGQKSKKVGGESILPLHYFEGTSANAPLIALQIDDAAAAGWSEWAIEPFKDVISDPVKWAARCLEKGADLICLHLDGTDPQGENKSADEAAALVKKKLAAAINRPLIAYGCGDEKKDVEVLTAVAAACKGENLLIGPAVKENYEAIARAVSENGHCIIAQTPMDINLEKELNVKLLKTVPPERIVIDPLSSAVGYGMEYSFTIIERTKLIGITFGDVAMQMPMIADLGGECWKTSQAKADRRQGILWESVTAMSLLLAGANILVLRHPESARLVPGKPSGKERAVAIKGTDIVKKLPEAGKKNCKECGLPTCFAFAMKLASGGIQLDKCIYMTPEVRAELEDALAPPIKPVTVGSGAAGFTVGDEQVMYRHEKTFVHQPGIAVLISDNESDQQVDEKIKKLKQVQFTWIGKTLKADLAALQFKSGDRTKYEALVKKAMAALDCPLMLISEDTEALLAAHILCADRNPLLYPVTSANIDRVIPAVNARPTTVAIKAAGVEGLAPLTEKLKEAGIEGVIMDSGSTDLLSAVRDQTLIRRAALKQSFRPLGYPTIGFPCFMTQDPLNEVVLASMFMIKYAGIIVLSHIDEHTLLPLLAQRLNIYTDPRMPMSMEEGVYPVNNPDANSPVLITSNWALTYFLVGSEVEASKVPAWLLVKEAGGLGILTAWAAGKFSGDSIAPFVKKSGIESKVNHRRLIIPGKVARIRGELKELLPDWEIILGPGDANEIPAYLPNLVKSWK